MIQVSLGNFDDSMITSILESYRYLDSAKNTEDLLLDAISIERKKSLRYGYKDVYYSKEILQNTNYQKFEKVVLEIANAFESNQFDSISWRLSKYHQNKTFQDDMLNILDIDHFHLGEKANNNGRAGELLFIYYYQENLYLVDIFNHESFFNKRILEIIYENWENSLEYDFSDLYQNSSYMDDKTRCQLFKKKHVNSTYEFTSHGKKKIIATKDIMSNGVPIEDYTKSMYIHSEYEYFKNHIDFFSNALYQYILNKYQISVETLNIQYIWIKDFGECFFETQCNIKFNLDENNDLIEICTCKAK